MKKIVFYTFLFNTLLSYAQESIQMHLNGYRAGDRIIKQQMEPASPGAEGRDVIWDFSGLTTVDENYPLFFYRELEEDTARIVGREHETRYIYEQKDNSIRLTGYDNRFVEMNFELPEVHLRFPFYFGDTLHSTFSGKGLYYQDSEMVAAGRTYVKADAVGTLITPGADTLTNVLRIKRIRIYDDIGVENAGMRLETYAWYAPGYRYPVFETVRSSVKKNNSEIDDYSVSFYFPPAALEDLAEDPENERIREAAKEDRGILIACRVSPTLVDNECSLFFELSKNAAVTIRLCDIIGNPVSAVMQQTFLPAGEYEKQIPMTGLKSGYYILNIQTDNYKTNMILIKK